MASGLTAFWRKGLRLSVANEAVLPHLLAWLVEAATAEGEQVFAADALDLAHERRQISPGHSEVVQDDLVAIVFREDALDGALVERVRPGDGAAAEQVDEAVHPGADAAM